MTDLLRQIEDENKRQDVPEFQPGDTVRVAVRIIEGEGDNQRERVQFFEGIVIARRGGGMNETFTVRRVTHGVGVERVFPLHSPIVQSVEVIRMGGPRRAKLYYLRDRVGRRARVRERMAKVSAVQEPEPVEEPEVAEDVTEAGSEEQ